MRTNKLSSLNYLPISRLYSLYDLTNRVLNKLRSVPSDVVCSINSINLLEQSILLPKYQQQLHQHREQLPTLDTDEQAIVEQIEQEGVCITSLNALAIPGSQEMVESAQLITAELAEQASFPRYAHKHTLMATARQIMAHPAIFSWGLSERLLKIVECYLGLPVAYDGLSFYYSVADGRDAGPRIWHRDREDWRMIKVAVYLNDVDEFGGPYQCVKPAINTWLVDTLPKYKGLTHAELQLLLQHQTADWLTSCVGKTGTVIFTDTARSYHRGKPPLTTDRAALFFHYFSYRPKNPFYCDRSLLSKNQVAELAKQLPPYQRQYLAWRDNYPGVSRYIPKNQMRVDNW